MTRTPMRRLLMAAVSTVAAAATVTAASPAVAADMFFSKRSGQYATVSWLEVGELPAAANAPGNAHIGDLWVEDLGNGRANVFGVVFDLQCPDGVTPSLPGGGHGEEPPPEPGPDQCTEEGVRFIEGGSFTFVIDRKLGSATLKGTLAVGSGHGGPTTGAPAVDITWVGRGATTTSRNTSTFTDGFTTSTFRYTSTDRAATIATGSRIGPMVFDDEGGEWSEARIGSFRSVDRFRG